MKSVQKLSATSWRRGLWAVPKRLILIRHGQSMGNIDEKEYGRTPDWRIPLSPKGVEQATAAGVALKELVGDDQVYFYVSPYERSKQTLRLIQQTIPTDQIIGYREDPRLREQDIANYQISEIMDDIWKRRDEFGKFFYRFPNGESGADVCDRISSFLEGFVREWNSPEIHHSGDANAVLVSHGLLIRLFVKSWFKLPVDAFEEMINPKNCDFIILERSTENPKMMTLLNESKEKLHIPVHFFKF